jgi:hypothetical protein
MPKASLSPRGDDDDDDVDDDYDVYVNDDNDDDVNDVEGDCCDRWLRVRARVDTTYLSVRGERGPFYILLFCRKTFAVMRSLKTDQQRQFCLLFVCIYYTLFLLTAWTGPVHLLPPVALTALLLATDRDKTTNRCVTLWAYIDERDGRLLEAGLERTIISSPRALSFAEATSLLDGGNTCYSGKSIISNARAVLTVAERNLSLWSQRHKERNQAAQK